MRAWLGGIQCFDAPGVGVSVLSEGNSLALAPQPLGSPRVLDDPFQRITSGPERPPKTMNPGYVLWNNDGECCAD